MYNFNLDKKVMEGNITAKILYTIYEQNEKIIQLLSKNDFNISDIDNKKEHKTLKSVCDKCNKSFKNLGSHKRFCKE